VVISCCERRRVGSFLVGRPILLDCMSCRPLSGARPVCIPSISNLRGYRPASLERCWHAGPCAGRLRVAVSRITIHCAKRLSSSYKHLRHRRFVLRIAFWSAGYCSCLCHCKYRTVEDIALGDRWCLPSCSSAYPQLLPLVLGAPYGFARGVRWLSSSSGACSVAP